MGYPALMFANELQRQTTAGLDRLILPCLGGLEDNYHAAETRASSLFWIYAHDRNASRLLGSLGLSCLPRHTLNRGMKLTPAVGTLANSTIVDQPASPPRASMFAHTLLLSRPSLADKIRLILITTRHFHDSADNQPDTPGQNRSNGSDSVSIHRSGIRRTRTRRHIATLISHSFASSDDLQDRGLTIRQHQSSSQGSAPLGPCDAAAGRFVNSSMWNVYRKLTRLRRRSWTTSEYPTSLEQ